MPNPAAAETPARLPRRPLGRLHAFLVSPKLAIALLVGVLASCLVGVTVFRGARAWELIFSTLWFNALLVLLALSAGTAFFSRIWKRKLTLVSAGMIVFHLSFLALLGGVVVNGLLHFKGALRLTEGETLANDDPRSYDRIERGRLFGFRRLRGETTLVRMHRDYKVGGQDKRAAYEIEVADGAARTRHVIYVTEYFDDHGVRYFTSVEGYSVLVVLHDDQGREIYGAHVPLQSIPQDDGSKLYATGTATRAAGFPFPAPPERPRFDLALSYWPSAQDRAGQVEFQVSALGGETAQGPSGTGAATQPAVPGAGGAAPPEGHPAAAGGAVGTGGRPRVGLVPVGGTFDAGDYRLEAKEIRYWVTMDVRYDPGLRFSLGSLVAGLVGMVLILAGRLRQGPRKKAA